MDEKIGPSELVMIAFPDETLKPEIASSFTDLVEKGLIRIIDLVMVSKDTDGNASLIEVQNFDEKIAEALARLGSETSGLLAEEDIEQLLDEIPANATVLALLFEHLWVKKFAIDVRESGGQLVFSERIPGIVVEAARAALLDATGVE